MNTSDGWGRLPQNATELTAEWLTSALAGSYPGTEVTSVYFGTVLHGTFSKVRLLLTYNEAGHSYRLPPTMFAKCCFEAHSRSPHLVEASRSEVLYYHERASEGLVNAPKCYYAGLDRESGTQLLLLEDLLARNATFGHALRPIDARIARIGLEMLARYHARWWNSPGKVRPETSAGGTIVTDDWMSEGAFERCRQWPRFEFVVPELRNREQFLKAVYKLWDSNLRAQHCLLLGDPHLGNCFFEVDGTPGFLDLQGDTLGCWAHDVTEFILTSLDIDVRRNHERPLLEFYLEQLRSRGVDAPTFDEAWKHYRRNTIWQATAAVCPVASQFESVCTAYTQRAMAAVRDLDALASFDD